MPVLSENKVRQLYHSITWAPGVGTGIDMDFFIVLSAGHLLPKAEWFSHGGKIGSAFVLVHLEDLKAAVYLLLVQTC